MEQAVPGNNVLEKTHSQLQHNMGTLRLQGSNSGSVNSQKVLPPAPSTNCLLIFPNTVRRQTKIKILQRCEQTSKDLIMVQRFAQIMAAIAVNIVTAMFINPLLSIFAPSAAPLSWSTIFCIARSVIYLLLCWVGVARASSPSFKYETADEVAIMTEIVRLKKDNQRRRIILKRQCGWIIERVWPDVLDMRMEQL